MLDQSWMPPFSAIGILNNDGRLSGGWLINDYNGFNAELTVYAPGCFVRRTIRACLANAFIDHKLLRLSASTRRDNARMRKILPRIGFEFEGLRRRYYGSRKRDDAFTYVLFRDKASRWIG